MIKIVAILGFSFKHQYELVTIIKDSHREGLLVKAPSIINLFIAIQIYTIITE